MLLVVVLMVAKCVLAGFCSAGPGQSLFSAGYTGINVFRRDTYQLHAQHHWVVVECKLGRVVASNQFETDRDSNFPWITPLELSPTLTLWGARRKELAERKLPIFKAGKVVGAFYAWDELKPVEPNPVSVIEAVGSAECFRRVEQYVLVKYCHVLRTPLPKSGISGWLAAHNNRVVLGKMDAFEKYNYTERDRWTKWNAANKLVNLVSGHMDEDTFPWSFDRLNGTSQ